MAKILSIEEIGEEDTYDLHIPVYNNFFLQNGILTHNTGKTFFIRGFMDRLYKTDYTIIIPSDVKNEFVSSNAPVQEKFAKKRIGGLLAGELPTRTPVMGLRPVFFKQAGLTQLPKNNFWFSCRLADLEKTDFMTILAVDSKAASPSQKLAAETVYNKVREKPESYNHYSDFESLINALEDIPDAAKASFRLKIKNLFDSGFFSNEVNMINNPVEWASQKMVIALNMEGYQLFSKSGAGYPQVVVSIVIRQFLKARTAMVNKEKTKYPVDRLFFFVDEANSFVPKNKEPSSKVEIIDSIKRDRRYGVYYALAYQSWGDIPDDVVTNSRYIFLPHNIDIDDMASAFETFTKMSVDSTRKNRLRRVQGQCNPKTHDWIVLDRNTGMHVIITPLSPMSRHAEMSR